MTAAGDAKGQRARRGLLLAAIVGLSVAQFMACGARTGLTHLLPEVVVDAEPVDTFTVPVGVDVATDLPPRSKINGLSLGDSHSCARRADGSVACWGKNTSGQLGHGTITSLELAPVGVVGLSDAIELSASYAHTCAREAAGTIVCWGDNTYGQLGNGTTTSSAVPVRVARITDALEIVSGAYHFCARTTNGSVLCWGRNDSGQLGNGTTTDAHEPVAVKGLTSAVALGAGDYHSCAVLEDASVVCWGKNSDGQLGDTSLVEQVSPVAVVNLTGAQELTAGEEHSCARTGGAVFCWGFNAYGQLGYGPNDGSLMGSLTPVDAMGVTSAVQIGGGDNQTCARNGDGTLLCWGQNNQGQIGDQPTEMLNTGNVLVPTRVVDMPDAVELAVGSEHTCARRRDDTVWCWGANDFGELGDGTLIEEGKPTRVLGL